MEQIDAKSVKFLNAVRYEGGTASISRIRSLSGLNRNEANYRFTKLEDLGLIDVTTEPSPGNLEDRKVAHLTGQARQVLERGIGSATTAGLTISDEPDATEVSRERFREMEREMEAMRESLQASTTEQREVRNLRERVDDLEEYVYDWHESAEEYLTAIRTVVETYLPIDDISRVNDDL